MFRQSLAAVNARLLRDVNDHPHETYFFFRSNKKIFFSTMLRRNIREDAECGEGEYSDGVVMRGDAAALQSMGAAESL
jgi:hypothetical protein